MVCWLTSLTVTREPLMKEGTLGGREGDQSPVSSRRRGRARVLLAYHLPVAGYLLAAILSLIVRLFAGVPPWLVIHLTLLGAATTAIVVWSAYFVDTLLVVAPARRRPPSLRVAALTAGVVGVLIGVPEGWNVVVIAGAALVAIVVGVHGWLLGAAVIRHRRARFAWLGWFYVPASACLVAGAALGATLAVTRTTDGRLFAAHVMVNVLGWVGMTVVGSACAMWPMILATRLPSETAGVARLSGAACGVGLALGVGGLLGSEPIAVGAGLAAYLLGVVVVLGFLLRTAVRVGRRPHAAVFVASGIVWLGAASVWLLLHGPGVLAVELDRVVPWLIPGFVVQVLLGALGYLVPVVFGGGPGGSARVRELLARWWPVRWAMLNVGVLLVLFGDRRLGSAHRWSALANTAWWLVGISAAWFLAVAGWGIAAILRMPPTLPAQTSR
ncbi:MAG: hypothetical protein K6T28_08270 [Acidothermus sp.]|nr:hypothetical protein [Acidothermus sp.]